MRRRGSTRGGLRAVLPVLAVLGAASGAEAQAPKGEDPPDGTGRPPVSLDRLLELPSGLDYGVEERGGRTPGEWRSEFRTLRARLAYEERQLEAAQAELQKIAGSSSSWSVGPPIPGATAANSEAPLDYRLRQEINRHKGEIEALERALRALEVEANLAGVPAQWRE